MENPPQVFAGTPDAGGPLPHGSKLPDHWRMARAAHVDLLLMGMPRVNLLLIAPDGVVRFVLESLLLDLHEPIAQWRPGEALALPPVDEAGTLVLHEPGSLTTRRSAPPARLARTGRWPNAGRQHVVCAAAARASRPAASSTRCTTG